MFGRRHRKQVAELERLEALEVSAYLSTTLAATGSPPVPETAGQPA